MHFHLHAHTGLHRPIRMNLRFTSQIHDLVTTVYNHLWSNIWINSLARFCHNGDGLDCNTIPYFLESNNDMMVSFFDANALYFMLKWQHQCTLDHTLTVTNELVSVIRLYIWWHQPLNASSVLFDLESERLELIEKSQKQFHTIVHLQVCHHQTRL